jgi:hypothetical protein
LAPPAPQPVARFCSSASRLLCRSLISLDCASAATAPHLPDASSFSKNRDCLLTTEIAQAFLAALFALPEAKRLLSGEHFSVDGQAMVIGEDLGQPS